MLLNTFNGYFFILLGYIIDDIRTANIDIGVATATKVPETVESVLKNTNLSEVREVLNGTRRILNGEEAFSNRPYMVYLKLPTNNPRYRDYKSWLCGGVIVHEEYILTSAACIEDAKHFYVVSGTYTHTIGDDRYNNPCIKNGAKKAIWKCVPRNYVFDGHENDNIRWMNNDIAIVKIEEEFDFNRKVKGCDYIPKPICYNNQSADLEKPDTVGSIAGWGSTDKYSDWVNARRVGDNNQVLLETTVEIVHKKRCKLRWGARYHNIIENYMICTRDLGTDPSEICNEKYVDCVDIFYESGEDGRRSISVPANETVHSAHHNVSGLGFRKVGASGHGGFCENDHGGPLVYGTGHNSIVIGIISACLVKERTNRCYGPFLYTSVWKNRHLINCAIYKEIAPDCSKLFRTSETHVETHISWADHPDGPAKSETNNNSTKTNVEVETTPTMEKKGDEEHKTTEKKEKKST